MIDVDELKRKLGTSEHRRILKQCGFDLNGERGDDLDGILGPKALGEGENGNFSVDLRSGRVKDWGSTGYEGDVIDVVEDTQRLDFQEALRWIAEEVGLDPDPLRSDRSTKGRSNGSSMPRGDGKVEDDPEVNVAQDRRGAAPEPIVSPEQVEKWHGRLMAKGEAPQAARQYLLSERGLHEGILELANVGLVPSNKIPDGDAWKGFYRPEARRADWWIIFPVPALYGEHIASVKGVAFDPEATDWKRGSDGEKIPSNAGPVTLWDLVPTEEDGSPRIDGPVVVCEGEVDALCALSHGFNAVTGTGGAGTFKPEWAPYIADLAPAQERGVVICYDGDDRGRRGANEEATPKLYEAGLEPRVVSLPDGKDVNDVLVEGGEADLHAHLAQAETFEPSESQTPLESNRTKNKEGADPAREYKPFPTNALLKPVRDYVKASTQALGDDVPNAMVAVPVLSVLSGAIGDAVRIELKRTWTEPPTLWTVLVGPSGSMKSPAFQHVLRPVYRREAQAKEEYEKQLAEWKKQDDPDPQDKPTRKRFRTGDATPEALVKLLEENPRGILLARDELGAWIGSFDRYANGAADLQFWIEIWQGAQASRDRAGEGNTTVDTPVVPVTGTIQPGTLQQKLDQVHFDSGFAARLILSKPPTPTKRWTEADVTPEVRKEHVRLLTRLQGLPRETRLSLTPGAKKQWIEYYNQANARLEERPEGAARAMAAKGITHTARLALVLHCCQLEEEKEPSDPYEIEPVSTCSMKAAIRIGSWLTRETLRVYNELDLATESKPPKLRFLERLPEEFKTSEAKKIAEKDDIPRRTLFDWLDKLRDSGDLEKVKRGLHRKT